MRYFVSVLAWMLMTCIVYASDINVEEYIEKAKNAYINEEYAYAAELYEAVLEQNLDSPYIYYNLGNAYFKDNKIGLSILNYEKAKKLSPNNEMIIHNLKIANQKTVDRIEPVPVLFYKKWWNRIKTIQSTDSWAILGLISVFLFFIFVSVFLLARTIGIKKISFFLSILALLFSAFSFVFANKTHKALTSEDHGIIMSVRTTAKSSPSQTAPDVFVIHEGTKVKITNEIGHWYEIRLANGNIGWIETTSVKLI